MTTTADRESALILHTLADQVDPDRPYIDDPVNWVAEKTGEHTIDVARQIMDSVVKNRYTAVPSCHDIGKSWTAARLAAWWIDSHPLGEAFVVTTAPTSHQVGAVLWAELANVHEMGDLAGYITATNEWKIERPKRRRKDRYGRASEHDGPSRLVAYGRKPADYNPSAFQGKHARYILIIIDEACGVPKQIYEAVDSLATNKNARVLAIGNPDDPASYFAEICRAGSGWNVIWIDALRSPGFTLKRVRQYPELLEYMLEEGIKPSKERIPENLYELLIDPEWVLERMKRWGVKSPTFTSKVRGRFPDVAIDTLIHPHWYELAKAREEPPRPTMAQLGVDVARYGVDKSIVLLRQGPHCRVVVEIPYGPITELAGLAISVGHSLGVALPPAAIDDSGIGGGVTDILEEEDYPVIPVIGQAAGLELMKNGKSRFKNRRSELYWRLREAFAGKSQTGADGWIDVDPDDIDLQAQLTNIKYKINRHAQIEVESKDNMVARGLESPDRADALMYSIAPDPSWVEKQPLLADTITGDLLDKKW